MNDGVSLRSTIAFAIREGRLPAEGWGADPEEVLACAEAEGVLALLEWRLRAAPARPFPGDATGVLLAQEVRVVAAQWLVRVHELSRVAESLGRAGIRTLLLKGTALAYWLYPEPYLRMGGDIDLLFESRAQTLHAAQVLSELGYEISSGQGSMNFEITCSRFEQGKLRSELDLHSRLLNAPVYARIFCFEELWSESVPLPGLDPNLRRLSGEHALAHACLNRALDRLNAIPDKLKLLYDIRLFCARMDTADWSAFLAMARRKGLCGVCLETLREAADTFAAPVPATALEDMQRTAATEPIDHRRLGNWGYMLVQNLKALPGTRERMRWMRERFLPKGKPGEPERTWPALVSAVIARCRRLLRRLTSRRP